MCAHTLNANAIIFPCVREPALPHLFHVITKVSPEGARGALLHIKQQTRAPLFMFLLEAN